MDHILFDDSNGMPTIRRYTKTCSMTDCNNTQSCFPDMSFFRFPKEICRAKEWLVISDRPDLLQRLDSGDINIHNHYLCEQHFPNQILDYLHKKMLIKTAKPLTMAELKEMLQKDSRYDGKLSARRYSQCNIRVGHEHKDEITGTDVESTKHDETTKRKIKDAIGDRIEKTPDCKLNVQDSLQIKWKRNKKEKKSPDTSIRAVQPLNHGAPAMDETWWKNYFKQKLELERERIEKEEQRHRDRMNFRKMAIMVQEKTEKIKIEAMNNLTNALLSLQQKRAMQ